VAADAGQIEVLQAFGELLRRDTVIADAGGIEAVALDLFVAERGHALERAVEIGGERSADREELQAHLVARRRLLWSHRERCERVGGGEGAGHLHEMPSADHRVTPGRLAYFRFQLSCAHGLASRRRSRPARPP